MERLFPETGCSNSRDHYRRANATNVDGFGADCMEKLGYKEKNRANHRD